MLIKSGLMTQASGSIGGMTAAQSRGAMYLRGRGGMTNPNTNRQQAVRVIIGSLASAWQGLTQAQRDGWAVYASNIPWSNALGDSIKLTAQQWYIACNTPRLQSALARIDNPPVIMSQADPPTLTLTPPPLVGSNVLSVDFDNAAAWANEVGGALLIQMSRQIAATRNYFRGPFRLAAAVLGDSTTAPTSPDSVVSPYGDSWGDGNVIYIRARVVRADGRTSPPVMLRSDPAAP